MTEQIGRVFPVHARSAGARHVDARAGIEFVRRCLAIDQVRFGTASGGASLRAVGARHPVPALLLQPLVENVTRHGLAPKLDPGASVCRRQPTTGIRISVEDDGVGMPPVKSWPESA